MLFVLELRPIGLVLPIGFQDGGCLRVLHAVLVHIRYLIYKEEGVDVIVDAVNGDVKGLVNRLKAISNVSTNYKSYSGISDDMDGKVDFIFKTDSVETDD